jgi:hypothetical protein
MMEHHANALALIYGGNLWQPYPGHWLLVIPRDDGSLVVFDREGVCLYQDERAMEDGEPVCEICLDESPSAAAY